MTARPKQFYWTWARYKNGIVVLTSTFTAARYFFIAGRIIPTWAGVPKH